MRKGLMLGFIGACAIVLFVHCSSYYGVTKAYKVPLMEYAEPLDRESFVTYLDTAAIDDWEGLWLLVGPDLHCFVAIEGINNASYNAYYSHRIRMWSAISYLQYTLFKQGQVVGYLGRGLYDDTKNMTVQAGILSQYGWYKGLVQLDKTRKYILIDAARENVGEYGMRRVYPIRSVEEDEYKVRYL